MSLRILDPATLPSIKQEQWKYTDIGRVLNAMIEGFETEPSSSSSYVLVHKKSGEICDKPENIIFTGEDKTYHRPELKIILEDGAQATLVEHHKGEGEYWKNMGTEIELGQNARLNHIRIQEDSPKAVQSNMVHISMGRESAVNCFSLNLGGKLTRHDIHCVFNAPVGDCQISGVNLLNGDQHGDTTILMEHIQPHCNSRQFYRSILDEQARGVFQGKVLVHKEGLKTDGYQLADTILLSNKARMNTKPELEIYADDVKCSHGTTTGQLDDKALFYLRARGLPEAHARMILAQAFVDELMNKIEDEQIYRHVKELAVKWLKERFNS